MEMVEVISLEPDDFEMLSIIAVKIPDMISGTKCSPSEMKQRILAFFFLAAFSSGAIISYPERF